MSLKLCDECWLSKPFKKHWEFAEKLEFDSVDNTDRNEILKEMFNYMPPKADPDRRIVIFPNNDKYEFMVKEIIEYDDKIIIKVLQIHLHTVSKNYMRGLKDQCLRHVEIVKYKSKDVKNYEQYYFDCIFSKKKKDFKKRSFYRKCQNKNNKLKNNKLENNDSSPKNNVKKITYNNMLKEKYDSDNSKNKKNKYKSHSKHKNICG